MRVAEYDLPMYASGRLEVVIVGGVTESSVVILVYSDAVNHAILVPPFSPQSQKQT